jgi:hypothetical protein
MLRIWGEFPRWMEGARLEPSKFLNEVVVPNVDALGQDQGNLRLAANAILTLDALAGILHADLHKRGLEQGDDRAFREKLASRHSEYRIVRDAAFALKTDN